MAIVFEHRPPGHASGARYALYPSRLLRDVSGRILFAWQRYRIQRELEGMPYDLHKDIGFRSWDKTTR